MVEKERKFLLSFLPEETKNMIPDEIQQGYLMINNGNQLRVRIINNTEGWICYKSFVSSTERNEYEYKIPIEDAIELFNSTTIKLTKRRYKLKWNNYLIDIDSYEKLRINVVEIEGSDIEKLTEFPIYFGMEITNNKQYSNISLAKQLLNK